MNTIDEYQYRSIKIKLVQMPKNSFLYPVSEHVAR